MLTAKGQTRVAKSWQGAEGPLTLRSPPPECGNVTRRRDQSSTEISRRCEPKAPATMRSVGQFGMAAISVVGLEVTMGNKDKGGRHTKKVAAKSLKQKRADKKATKGSGKQNTIISP